MLLLFLERGGGGEKNFIVYNTPHLVKSTQKHNALKFKPFTSPFPVLLQNGGKLHWLQHKTDLVLTGHNFIRKPILYRKLPKRCIRFFITLIFYHRTVVKQIITHLLSYTDTVLWCSHSDTHRCVAAPIFHELVASVDFFGATSYFKKMVHNNHESDALRNISQLLKAMSQQLTFDAQVWAKLWY
jgi:hypothetical protein